MSSSAGIRPELRLVRLWAGWSLVAKGLDRVHEGGSASRVQAKENADGHRNTECQEHGRPGDERLLIGDEVDDDPRDGNSQRHTEQSADAGKDDGLDQELLGDVTPLGPQGA